MTRTLVLLCLGAAATAHAQFSFFIPRDLSCAAVTVAACQRPGALTGTCATQCTALLRLEYLRQTSTAPQSVVTVAENLAGANSLTLAATSPDSPSTHFMYGGTTTSAQVLERQRTTFLASGGGLGGSLYVIDPHSPWRNNGARVASCDELVFDFFRSVSDFEDANRGASRLELFRAAYAAGGIAFQNLRTADGFDVGPFPMLGPAPKNAYFSTLDTRLPNGATSPGNASWNARLGPYSASAVWDWSKHQLWGNWFTWFYTPEYLDSLAADQQEYLGRIAARRARYDQYEAELADCVAAHGSATHATCVALGTTARSELENLDFAIGFELTNADARGALSTSLVNPWDWSPLFFERWLQENLSRVREPMRSKCMRVSSGSFTSGVVAAVLPGGAGIPNSSGGYAVAPADWLRTPGEANVMLSLIENWAKNFDVPRDPATGRATLAQWHGDATTLGNDRFGVSYDWTVGWGLTNIETRLCQGQLEARGYFHAGATVLGRSQELLLADAHAWSENAETAGDTDLLTHREVRVLGTPIYAPADERTPLNFHLSTGESRTQSAELAVIYVPVFGVPVKVAGGVSGTEGFSVNVDGGLTRTCSQQGPQLDDLRVGATGEVTPFISIDAYASASVDAFVIEAGIKGEVTLVKGKLPLTLRVQTILRDENPDPNLEQLVLALEAETRLGLSLSALDGRVSVYGRVFGRSSEKELISWRGPQLADATLFELRYVPAVRLDLLQLATRY